MSCNLTGLGFGVNRSLSMGNISRLTGNCSFDFNFDHFPRPNGPDKNTEISLKLTFYFLAGVGNILLLFIMYKDPLKRFRNSPSYFVCNLTIADLLSIVGGICDSIFQLNPEKAGQNGQEIVGCVVGIGLQCSFLVMMFFAIDRYVAILHPYKYKDIITKKVVLITLILLPWCFAIVALPVIYFAPAYRGGRTLTNLFAGNIIVLSAITLIVHPLTHWSFKKRVKDLSTSNYTDKLILEENLRVAIALATTVLMVSACLIIFMTPYLVAFSFNLAGCDKCFLNHTFQSFWKYYPLLMAVRLMINNFAYSWRLPLYRKSLKAVIFHGRSRPITRIHLSRANGSSAIENAEKASDRTESVHLSQRKTSPEGSNYKDIPMRTMSNLSGELKEIGIENHALDSKETSFNQKL